MPSQAFLAKHGLLLGELGSAADLAIAAPLADGNYSPAAATDAARTGLFFSRTPGAELVGIVAGGIASLLVGFAAITAVGALNVSGIVTAGGLEVNRGTPASNLFLGLDAGNETMTGIKNIAVGFQTLKATTSGFENTAIGYLALSANTGGFYNVAIGSEALKVSSAGNGNVAVGGGALKACTTGGVNAAVGFEALRHLTTGIHNSLLGCDSGAGLTTGSRNTILGANITGLAADLQANIIIANGLGGAGAIKARNDGTKWILWDLIECYNTTDATSRYAAAFTIDGGLGVNKGVHAGRLTLTQDVITSGSPTLMLLTGAAHTTLAASVEVTDVNFNLARTVQLSTGALTTPRAVRVQAPTYAFVGASTITDAATLAISGAPVAGANATITNPWALWVQGGDSLFAGNVLISGAARVDAGTAAAPTFGFTADTNTGIYNIGADQLGISAGGALSLSVSTSLVTSVVPLLASVLTENVAITSTLTRQNRKRVRATAAAIIVSVWATPIDGDIVVIRNASGGSVTVGRNGENIDGAAANLTLANGESIELTYFSGSGWWGF